MNYAYLTLWHPKFPPSEEFVCWFSLRQQIPGFCEEPRLLLQLHHGQSLMILELMEKLSREAPLAVVPNTAPYFPRAMVHRTLILLLGRVF